MQNPNVTFLAGLIGGIIIGISITQGAPVGWNWTPTGAAWVQAVGSIVSIVVVIAIWVIQHHADKVQEKLRLAPAAEKCRMLVDKIMSVQDSLEPLRKWPKNPPKAVFAKAISEEIVGEIREAITSIERNDIHINSFPGAIFFVNEIKKSLETISIALETEFNVEYSKYSEGERFFFTAEKYSPAAAARSADYAKLFKDLWHECEGNIDVIISYSATIKHSVEQTVSS